MNARDGKFDSDSVPPLQCFALSSNSTFFLNELYKLNIRPQFDVQIEQKELFRFIITNSHKIPFQTIYEQFKIKDSGNPKTDYQSIEISTSKLTLFTVLVLLNHKNILEFQGCLRNGSRILIYYKNYPSLLDNAQLIRLYWKKNNKNKVSAATSIIEAIEYLHFFSTCHRNVQISSLCYDNETNQIYITPFDVRYSDNSHTISAPDYNYCAPEIAHSYQENWSVLANDLYLKSDVYSLGHVLFELYYLKKHCNITKLMEFSEFKQEGLDFTSILSSPYCIPSDCKWKDIILQCWTVNPEQRPSVSIIAEKFQTILPKRIILSEVVCVFVDHSNFFKPNLDLRTFIKNKLLFQRVLQFGTVIGSKHVGDDWEIWKEYGFQIKKLILQYKDQERKEGNAVDTFLHYSVNDTINTCESLKKRPTIILITGDGNNHDGFSSFPKVVENCINLNFRCELWSWKTSLSNRFRVLAKGTPMFVVKYLDNDINILSNISRKIPNEQSAPQTKNTQTAVGVKKKRNNLRRSKGKLDQPPINPDFFRKLEYNQEMFLDLPIWTQAREVLRIGSPLYL